MVKPRGCLTREGAHGNLDTKRFVRWEDKGDLVPDFSLLFALFALYLFYLVSWCLDFLGPPLALLTPAWQ